MSWSVCRFPTGSAYLPLAFGEFLRARGWNKPITCGGSFATLARHWLLDRYLWLHSRGSLCWRGAPGASGPGAAEGPRRGAGFPPQPPARRRASRPVIDEKPMGLWPLRGDLPEVLATGGAYPGHRGCAGRCGYCAPASLQIQEAKEGQRAGGAARGVAAVRCGRRTAPTGRGPVRRRWVPVARARRALFLFRGRAPVAYAEADARIFSTAWRGLDGGGSATWASAPCCARIA